MTARANLFSSAAFIDLDEAIDLTVASLLAYWPRHGHYGIAWSGGKDSTATLTLIIWLIDTGRLPQPDVLHVLYVLTLTARIEALEKILDIQQRARVDLINEEEEARIRELIAARTFPDKWNGEEPSAAAWLDSINPNGTVQPILFRDLVGA